MMKYTAAAAAVALFALPCLGAEPVHLGYKFEAGAPIRHQMVQEMTQTQSIQGQQMESSSKTTTEMSTELLGTNEDGSVLIGTTTKSVAMTVNAPGMDMSYDSTNPGDKSKVSDPAVASVAGMVGLQIQLHIAPDGTVLDVPNMDAIQSKIDAMTDPAMKAAMDMSMGKDEIMASNEMNYKLLPEKAVEVGDTWKREFKVPMGFGDMTISMDMTLKAVKDGIASIAIDGSISMPQVKEQGMTMNLTGSKLGGTLEFNIDDGVQESYDLNTSMDMSATMDGMEGAPPVFSMNMNQHVKLTRLGE